MHETVEDISFLTHVTTWFMHIMTYCAKEKRKCRRGAIFPAEDKNAELPGHLPLKPEMILENPEVLVPTAVVLLFSDSGWNAEGWP